MRAAVCHAPRDLRIESVEVPALGPRDVLVRMERGGICGSDLHYYLHGGFGAIRIKQPLILGHEIAGVVDAVGGEVASVKAGDRVAVNPSRACNQCRYCLKGMQNHCLDMRFYGSAMRFPHVQGGFRDAMVIDESQAVKVGTEISAEEAAFCEPLAVCLHAVNRAGPLVGRRVLITGSGPIGALSALAARRAGAAEIVATDLSEAPLAIMRRIGVDRAINIALEQDALPQYSADKGYFDVVMECSGAPPALRSALDAVRAGGTIVMIGNGGDVTFPSSIVVVKEVEIRGSFRFHEEFATAAALIGKGLIDVKPLLTATLPLDKAVEAFELAADKSRAMKVQLAFN